MPDIEFIYPKWECSQCHSPAQQSVRVVDGRLSPPFFYLPQKCISCGRLLHFYQVLDGYTVETIRKADRVLV